MDNPFYRRATEQLRGRRGISLHRQPSAPHVPTKRPAEQGTLYDRIVLFRGAPGTGKTTLARLFEFCVRALLRSTGSTDYEAVAGALEECGAIKNGLPVLLGCRLPMETDYRDFWEFPYPEGLKAGMLFSFIQARAVLAWFRHLHAAGVAESAVTIVPRADSGSGLEIIGGTSGSTMLQRVREVECAVYEIEALVAPSESAIPPSVTGTYRPFDVIDRIEVTTPSLNQGKPLQLIPLVMLDDAHWLHPGQFEAMRHWLARRELKIARWVLTRFDILYPAERCPLLPMTERTALAIRGFPRHAMRKPSFFRAGGQRKDQRNTFRRMV